MNRSLQFLLCSFVLFLFGDCYGQPQAGEILDRYRKTLGTEKIRSWNMTGVIYFEAYNLKIPFRAAYDYSRGFVFVQEEVQTGMDLNPQVKNVCYGGKAFFEIDATPVGEGIQHEDLDEEATQIWQETMMLAPFSLLFYTEKGFKYTLKEDSEEARTLAFSLPSGNKSFVRINKKTALPELLEFTGYHTQLGSVNIKRQIESYRDLSGLKYPAKWIDQRGKTRITYTVEHAELNQVIDPSLFHPATGQEGGVLLTADDKLRLVESYADALNKYSPFVESNRKIKQGLRQYLQEGKYQEVSGVQQLATRISQDAIALSDDHHFGMQYDPDLFESLQSSEHETKVDEHYDEVVRQEELSNNFYFSKATMTDGMYLMKMHQFSRLKYAKDFIDSLMVAAIGAKALVFDLRGNSGGADGLGSYIASYLLPENTHLFTRVTKAQTEEIMTSVVPTTSWHKEIPVYVIIDGRSVSAAEQFAYLLQNHGRATVIGHTSFGAAHGSIDVPLQNGVVGFVPFGFEQHIKTGRDWEGGGVVPDVEIDPGDALAYIRQLLSE